MENEQLVKLSSEDMAVLDHYHKRPGQHRSLMGYHKDGGVFGWTYEELGWELTGNGVVKE